MSKRAVDSLMENSEKQKRKSLSLLIAHRVELLQKLDSGVSVRHLTEDYGVSFTVQFFFSPSSRKKAPDHHLLQEYENIKSSHEESTCAGYNKAMSFTSTAW